MDSMICDCYVRAGEEIYRPVLSLCVDAYSGLIYGYALGRQGGTGHLADLLRTMYGNKREIGERLGIKIGEGDFPEGMIPGIVVTDRGREYVSDAFLAMLRELGIRQVVLPPFRADQKGTVKRMFGVLSGIVRPELVRYGYVEKDEIPQTSPGRCCLPPIWNGSCSGRWTT